MGISSGVLSGYTKTDKDFFTESYKLFGSGTEKKPLFKLIDTKRGKMEYYVLTEFIKKNK